MSNAQAGVPAFMRFWGKARPHHESAAAWHPAALHSLDVAAVAHALLQAHPARAQAAASACDWKLHDWIRTVIFLIGLHDIGKFSRAFQCKAEHVWPQDVLGPYKPAPGLPHDQVGLKLLVHPVGVQPHKALFADWQVPQQHLELLYAVAGHHGRPASDQDLFQGGIQPSVACKTCVSAANDFASHLKNLLDPPVLPEPPSDRGLVAASWWLAGFTVVCDWLGSSQYSFPYVGTHAPALLDTYWKDVALPRASQAIQASGLLPARVSVPRGVRTLQPDIQEPTPVQRWAESAELPAGPICVLIEDITGSGKTEAALAIAHRLMHDGRADGVFVALPTMATADAMFARVADACGRLFAAQSSPSLALAHSRAGLNERFTGSILREAAPIKAGNEACERDAVSDKNDAADETASAQCAAWLADDRRLAFLAHVGVGTIDQALLAVLSTRHAPLRMHGLARKVLLIDEAHAYDAYMNEEIDRLLEFQAALGGSALILSATLPQVRRERLLSAFRRGLGAATVQPTRVDYPLVTVVAADAFDERPCDAREESKRSVAVRRLESVDECVHALVAASRQGACAAWVRNTVGDVLDGAQRLRAQGVEPIVFHARYAMGDRLVIQDRVLSFFGKGSTPMQRAPGGRGQVIVATQVIEQSLDLDFDFMVSDLAPIDLLIQRAGRLWRHVRTWRPLAVAELAVLSPPPVPLPSRAWAGILGGTPYLYRVDVLWRTACALFGAGCIDSPDGVRGLVEAVYGKCADAVPEGLEDAAWRARAKEQVAQGQAQAVLLRFVSGYKPNAGMWDPDIFVPTRLGELQTTIRLAVAADGRLQPLCPQDNPRKAWALSEISVPRRLATGAHVDAGDLAALQRLRSQWPLWERDMAVAVLAPAGDGWSLRLVRNDGHLSVRYDRETGLQFDKGRA